MSIFILGLIIGAVLGVLIYSEFNQVNIKKVLSTVKTELRRAYEEGVQYGLVQPQIDRINEISKEQVEYLGALDRPNASAAHSRHKNSIITLIKKLEEEKITLFKSILNSGSDPLLTVMLDGKQASMRVSKLLPILESFTSPATSNPKTDSKSPSVTKGLRLVADNTKENQDVQPKPSDPTVH